MSDGCLGTGGTRSWQVRSGRSHMPPARPVGWLMAGLAAAVITTGAMSAVGQPAITWTRDYFNPAPDFDDLTLPMPCGGAMTFRRVDTPVASDMLDDRLVVLGSADQDLGYSEYILREHLVGGFNDFPFGGDRVTYYFLGKYEVTRDQYAAVAGDSCPAASLRGRLPMTDVSWFDAIAFSEAYTTWLWANAPDALPTEGDRRAYLRLPTETEWEYAVRGGAAVSEQEFRHRLFPHGNSLVEAAWFQGPRSAGGALQLTGLLEPNPLNLHDMLGNAEELVLEPYRLNRVGRRHGQVGGMVTRGGSFRTPEASLRNSLRVEYSFFDESTGAATRLETIGFRLVLSVPVAVSLRRIEEFRTAWAEAAAVEPSDDAAIDPVDALEDLAEATTDVERQQQLDLISAALAAEEAQDEQVAARALRSAISSGAVLIRSLRYDNGVIRATETALNFESQLNAQSDRARRLAEQVAAMRERYDITLRAYFDILVQAADDYDPEVHQEQLRVAQRDFEEQELGTLAEFAQLFVDQALNYQQTQALDAERLEAELVQP